MFAPATKNSQRHSGERYPQGNYYANPAIYAPGGVSLSNVRINYAEQAVWAGDGGNITLSDSQVLNSSVMAVLGLGDGYGSPAALTCNNCLYSPPSYGVLVVDGGGYDVTDHYNLTNCTVNNVFYLEYGPYRSYYGSGNAVNSIFANGNMNEGFSTWQGSYNGFYSAGTTFGSPKTTATSNPFQPSGSFYLATGCPFRNAGTTAISPALLADLQNGTTYALQNGAWPDTNGTDLGYHYPEDSDYDGLPDWWELYWFGTLAESGTNLDASGNTLLSDYQNYLNGTPTDPNVIQFSIETTNNYVSAANAGVQLNITVGVPGKYAVSVDDTNYAADASWQTFTGTNLTVNLGLTQGWHDVWIALKGPATNATVTWQWKHLKLDTTAPQLVITSPTNGTVNVPMIQVTGYSPMALGSISYDLTNALGLVTNQQVLITDQTYSTNTWEFTTNTFQAFDVSLTNGVNTFTFHATDLAGNVTTLTTNFTLDYSSKTNPPAFSLTWPTNGTQISGADFTWDGFVSDPTVTISATITDTNGDTNVVTGLVERNGKFWVENLPLNSGTNALTLTVTDAVGNTSVTNISVVQSSLILTMNPVTPDSQLWQPTVNLTGTISDASQAVWVNGVKGHNNGDGTWSATNVPTTAGGTASFTITAYGPTEQQPDHSFGN